MEILVITNRPATGGSIYERAVYEGLRGEFDTKLLRFKPEWPRLLHYRKLRAAFQLWVSGRRHVDLIVTNMSGVYAGALAIRGAKKIVIFHHMEDLNDKQVPFRAKWFGEVALKALKKADAVVVVAEYWRRYLLPYVESERIHVVYNAFNVQEIDRILADGQNAGGKEMFGLPEGKKIIYGGNAMKEKGIRRVEGYVEPFDDLYLVTSGRKDCDCRSRHFDLGYGDYLRLLQVCDASVLLSKMPEGWNRCAHESILCATPVVGTDNTGLGELLRLTGQEFVNEKDGPGEFRTTLERAWAKNSGMKEARAKIVQFDKPYFWNEWLHIVKRVMS